MSKIIIILTLLLISSSVANAQIIPKEYFGMHIQKFDSIPWPSITFKSLRLWDGRTRWDNIELSDNKFNFSKLDLAIDLATKNNVEVLYTLGLTPRWASSRPNEQSVLNKLGIASEPANMEHWKRYVRKVAQRYKGKIKYYEVWNEPASKGFYTGDIPTLVNMTKYAYEIIKEVDPDAKIVSPPSTAASNGSEWLDNFLKLGGGNYVDIIGYHFYVPGKPELTPKVIKHVKKILAKHKIHKPIWNTESGWSNASNVDISLQGPYVARSYIINWSEGVERYYWYAWDERSWVGIFMTEKDNITPTKAAKAYETVQKWLVGSLLKSCTQDMFDNWICSLTNKTNRNVWLIWNPDKKVSFSIPSTWNVNHFDTLENITMSIPSNNTIDIGPSPIYLYSMEK